MKYVCGICGFEYDESAGHPESGISPGTKWEDIPDDWLCPLCGASKDEFNGEKGNNTLSDSKQEPATEESNIKNTGDFSFGEISALFSNLSKACEKQLLNEESELFNQLAEYYNSKITPTEKNQLDDLITMIQDDLNLYSTASNVAANNADRGALRALVWGEKVTKMLSSIIKRYQSQKDTLLENTSIHVCEICGFTYIGDEAPDICPVCKVQKSKITEIKRRS